LGRDHQTVPGRLSCRGNVTHVFPGNREYTVEFDDCWSVVEYEDIEPMVGSTSAFRVTRLLERTHRILLTPAT
jgi:hypothetical protein